MVTDKKPTKSISKAPNKSTSEKPRQERLELVKSANPPQDVPPISSLSLSDVEPPDGFRVVSISQALWEYGIPLMQMIPAPEDVAKANELFVVVTSIWNYTLDDKSKHKNRKSEADILALIHKELGLDQAQAADFFSMMVDRKHFLFPSEVQPNGCPFMFLRKEVRYLINRFDYEDLEFSPEIIHPNTLDLKVLKNLEKLDQYILRSADYDKYEKLSLKVRNECLKRFHIWLTNKGLEEHQRTLAYVADVYLTFLYGYLHEEPVTLKSGPGKFFVGFMVEFLLGRTSMEPWEYTLCPASIKLFYEFLYEKGYLVEAPDRMIDFIDRFEPHFIDILRERFS